jgi:hypothetical protein
MKESSNEIFLCYSAWCKNVKFSTNKDDFEKNHNHC